MYHCLLHSSSAMKAMVLLLILSTATAISFSRKQQSDGKFIILNNAGYFQLNNITHRFPDKYTVMAYNCNPYYQQNSEHSNVLRSPEPFDKSSIVIGEDIDSLWDSYNSNKYLLQLRQKYPQFVPIIQENIKVFNGINVGIIYRPEYGDWLIAHRHGVLSVGGGKSSLSSLSSGNQTSMSTNLTLAMSWLNDSILNKNLMDVSDPLRISEDIPDPRFFRTSDGRYFLVSNRHSEHPRHIYPFYIEILTKSTSDTSTTENLKLTNRRSVTKISQEITFIEVNKVDQKNWTPFEFNNEIYFLSSVWPFHVVSVSINPKKSWIGKMVKFMHQNIDPSCMKLHTWSYYHHILRGGTQAIQLSENRYFSIFHASGNVSYDDYGVLKTYTMGAYTFEMMIENSTTSSSKISSRVLSISPIPFIHDSWYIGNWSYQPSAFGVFDYIVFPLTIMLEDDNLFLVYGKQDKETWISKFRLSNVLSTMIPVNRDGTCTF